MNTDNLIQRIKDLESENENLRKEREEILEICDEEYSSTEKIQDIRKVLKWKINNQ